MRSPKRARTFLVLTFLLPAVVATGVWFFRARIAASKEMRGVVLVSIDTCRADYLSCYGYARESTPHIDALAGRGALFENAISPVPLTLPAHVTMLTGTSPLYHGVHDNTGYKLGPSHVTLAERLRQAGFATAAMVSAFVMDSQFGLDQGFDTYNDRFDKTLKGVVGIAERKGEEVSRHAARWLSEHHREPFFLFLHYYDPHADYEPPEPFATRFADSPYAGEIAYTDHCIGQVVNKLKDLGVLDKTLIIITSDHGEMLGEHGEKTHGYFVYQSAIKVPLIFRLPGEVKARSVKELVGLADIVPTVCGFLGMEPPEKTHGRDLSACLRGRNLPRENATLYCESFFPTRYDACSLLGVVTERWKYIQTTRPELYDLSQDPGESANVVDRYPHEAQGLKETLQHILEGQARQGAADNGLELDAEARRRLESLGYVGGTGVDPNRTNDFGFDPSKDDPKDLIDAHNMDVAMQMRLSLKEYDKAEELCRELRAERPHHPSLSAAMAEISLARGNLSGATSYLGEALKLNADDPRIHSQLGYVCVKQGKIAEAIKHCEIALELGCEEAVTHHSLGVALYQQGEYEEAVYHFNKALEIDPDAGEVHYNLGNALLKQGKREEADSHFENARQLGHEPSVTSERLGLKLLRQGKVEEAIVHFNKALETDPNNARTHLNLGSALARRGDTDPASEHFSKALAIDPEMAQAHNNLANVHAQKNQVTEAINHYRRSLQIKPDQPLVLYGLGSAYARQEQAEQVIQCWTRALALKPEWPMVLNDLAWIRATHEDARFRDPEEAVSLARRACELTQFERPQALATLAAAYAADGDFDQSVQASEKVLTLIRASGQDRMIPEAQRRLQLYRDGQPYRAPEAASP